MNVLAVLAVIIPMFTSGGRGVDVPSPPGGGGATWRGNEPAGMTFIDERPFNMLTENDTPHVPFWNATGGSIVTDASAPHSPSNVLRGLYAAGMVGGSAAMGSSVEGQGISYKTLYVCWWSKYSANWQGHITGVNKQSYFSANGDPATTGWSAIGVGAADLVPEFFSQAGQSTDGYYRPNLIPSAVVPRGQWNYIEVVLVGNTAGNADGTVDWFVNGAHVGSISGMIFETAAAKWDRYALDPVWGGIGDAVTADMTFDVDHVYLSGKN